MRCPYCGAKTHVIISAKEDAHIFRMRECNENKYHRFSTDERIDQNAVINIARIRYKRVKQKNETKHGGMELGTEGAKSIKAVQTEELRTDVIGR